MGHPVHIFFLVLACAFLSVGKAEACTAVIISGKATADGRPMIWKNRDTGNLDNSIRYFDGEKYSFTGLADSGSKGGEVWIGINTAGFAIMNTASYCLKDDDVPSSEMDREGILMYRALEICSDIGDFENFLDTLSRPMGVEANFCCIDAYGGAACYETGNTSYHKIDVNECEDGFLVVTNFSVSGDPRRWKGVERYRTAYSIFREMQAEGSLARIHPLGIIDSLSRSYRHEVMGIDLRRDAERFLSHTSGCFADLDFIPRRSTSASVVIHGVAPGDDPFKSVIWAALGYPPASVAVPVPLAAEDHIPDALSSYPDSDKDSFCGLSLYIRESFVFYEDVSSMSRYVNLKYVLGDSDCTQSTVGCSIKAEAGIRELFDAIYHGYLSGQLSLQEYHEKYDCISPQFFDICSHSFDCYLHCPGPSDTNDIDNG